MHEGPRGAGQWKDLQGIRQILNRLGTAWREFFFDGANTEDLVLALKNSDDVVLWYYSFWPEALEQIRTACPRARIVLRTVNAEALQHWTRAEKDWRRWRGLPRDVYGFFRLLRRDRRCARAAHRLAGISPWDDRHYWRRQAGPQKVRTAPYFCPWPALLPAVAPRPWADRENAIVCLAGGRDTIGRGHVEEFGILAQRPEFRSWRFLLSAGLLKSAADSVPDRVERIGRLEEPWELLCRVKAVAVLSKAGFGFKTTIADALAAGAHALVHPRQHARLADEDRQLAVAVDGAAGIGLAALAVVLNDAPAYTPKQVQERQADCAEQAWKDILIGGGPAP